MNVPYPACLIETALNRIYVQFINLKDKILTKFQIMLRAMCTVTLTGCRDTE